MTNNRRVTITVLVVFLYSLLQSTLVMAFISSPVIRLGSVAPLKKGEKYTIQASVNDEYGIEKVILHYRRIGDEQYLTATMQRQGGSDIYMYTFAPGDIPEPGLQYYVRAVSTTGAVSAMPDKRQTTVEIVYGHLKDKEKKARGLKWLMIGVGVLAVGALASSGGGGGGGDGAAGAESVADVTITTPLPGSP